MQVEKTVFISYRRTNAMTARAVYQHLRARRYDCFLDYESIDAGLFERIILNQITARAHFIVILTPSALERCAEPDDWLRREIEYALEQKRNIVPLMFEGFSYSDMQRYLTGKLGELPKYNSLEVPSAYFEEAMSRLQKRFLKIPVNVILQPTPNADKQAVAEAKAQVERQPTVTEANLSAEKWFERGLKRTEDDYNGQIEDYTEAIRLNPSYAEAFLHRGLAYDDKEDSDNAFIDYNETIRLNPKLHAAYVCRGFIHFDRGNLDAAITDFDEAIRIEPRDSVVYYFRGNVYLYKDEFDAAIIDYDEAIRLNPIDAEAYNNRGIAQSHKQNYDAAIVDYETVLRIKPDHKLAKKNLAQVRNEKIGNLTTPPT